MPGPPSARAQAKAKTADVEETLPEGWTGIRHIRIEPLEKGAFKNDKAISLTVDEALTLAELRLYLYYARNKLQILDNLKKPSEVILVRRFEGTTGTYVPKALTRESETLYYQRQHWSDRDGCCTIC